MCKVMFITIFVGAVYLTAGVRSKKVFGESCEDRTHPEMREIAGCCDAHKHMPADEQKAMEQLMKSCSEARSDYKCMLECVYKKKGILKEDGALDKEKYIQKTVESYKEDFKEAATTVAKKCLGETKDKTAKFDVCSEAGEIVQLSKCFMAEMTVSCPEKHFNDTEVCRKGREYFKDCAGVFSQA